MSGLAQAFLMLSECQAGVPWMCHTILVSKNRKIVLLRKGLQGAGPWGHALDAEAGSGLAACLSLLASSPDTRVLGSWEEPRSIIYGQAA